MTQLQFLLLKLTYNGFFLYSNFVSTRNYSVNFSQFQCFKTEPITKKSIQFMVVNSNGSFYLQLFSFLFFLLLFIAGVRLCSLFPPSWILADKYYCLPSYSAFLWSTNFLISVLTLLAFVTHHHTRTESTRKRSTYLCKPTFLNGQMCWTSACHQSDQFPQNVFFVCEKKTIVNLLCQCGILKVKS